MNELVLNEDVDSRRRLFRVCSAVGALPLCHAVLML